MMFFNPLVPKTKNKQTTKGENKKKKKKKKKATPQIGIKKGYIDNNLTKLQIYTQIPRSKKTEGGPMQPGRYWG